MKVFDPATFPEGETKSRVRSATVGTRTDRQDRPGTPLNREEKMRRAGASFAFQPVNLPGAVPISLIGLIRHVGQHKLPFSISPKLSFADLAQSATGKTMRLSI